jgi:hypothetical protein
MGEEPLPLPQYLDGINRQRLLTVGAHLIASNPQNAENLNYDQFLDNFFSPENEDFKNDARQRLANYHGQIGRPISIVNTVSSLTFFQYAFDRADMPQTQSDAQAERSIFLAYLAITQATRSVEDNVIPSVKDIKGDEGLFAIFFTQAYAYANLDNYNMRELFVGQLIKAAFFFDFLDQAERTKPLYLKFLSDFALEKGTDFLVRTFSFINGILTNEKEGFLDFHVPPGPAFEPNCNFIEKLVLPEGSMNDSEDFIRIRERPFYRIERGTYRIIFRLFVIEKIFKSLYFALKAINDSFQEDQQVKGLRSIITDDFSEKVIVYEILNSIYKKDYIAFTGKELKATGIKAEPDYYLRKGRKVFLFESKDFLIDAATKTSHDYTVIRPKLERVFLKDHKDRAILQLLKTCEKILTSDFSADNGCDAKKALIYPIVIVHDNQYDVIGLNHIVNTWFDEQLKTLKDRGVRTEAIKPLTIINIDTLIFHQDLLRSKQVILEDIIERYITRCSLKNVRYKSDAHKMDVLTKRMRPFSFFFNEDPVVNKKASVPKMLKEKVGVLFTIK